MTREIKIFKDYLIEYRLVEHEILKPYNAPDSFIYYISPLAIDPESCHRRAKSRFTHGLRS